MIKSMLDFFKILMKTKLKKIFFPVSYGIPQGTIVPQGTILFSESNFPIKGIRAD